jgi:uncharacterized membrane protein
MQNDKNKQATRLIAVSGIMGGLTLLLGITHWGMIPWFSGAALTVMQVPVIVAALIEGPIAGTTVGVIFGVMSWILASVGPTGPSDPLFANPLVSVLPRLFIGIVSYLVYRSLRGGSGARRVALATAAAGVAGSLANTALVLLMLKLCNYGMFPWSLVGLTAAANGLPEAGVAAVITTAVVLAWKRIALRGTKATVADDEGEA